MRSADLATDAIMLRPRRSRRQAMACSRRWLSPRRQLHTAEPICRRGTVLVATPVVMSRATIDAVFASHGSAFDGTVSSANISQSARPWAWLAANESLGSPRTRIEKTMAVEAWNKVLARFGV